MTTGGLLKARTLALLIAIGIATSASAVLPSIASADPLPRATASVAVGPQYDSTHAYVAAADFDRFVASLIATFGGKTSPQGVFQVTPTPSKTKSQLVQTPAGMISVFGFVTPVPYPFGSERTGYLVSDFDAGVRAAQASGADVVVSGFNDPIGRDAIVQWPGGVNMQLYWHTVAPNYAPLATIPENRIYLSAQSVDPFVKDFLAFSRGSVVSDSRNAPGVEIGRPGDTYRRIRLTSPFGTMILFVTDGALPYPFGREVSGYTVSDLKETLAKATQAGATVLNGPYPIDIGDAAIVQFPGGYIAEIQSPANPHR